MDMFREREREKENVEKVEKDRKQIQIIRQICRKADGNRKIDRKIGIYKIDIDIDRWIGIQIDRQMDMMREREGG